MACVVLGCGERQPYGPWGNYVCLVHLTCSIAHPPPPPPRHSVYWLGGHLYAPTGSTYVSTDVVWRYSIQSNSWTCLEPMPMPMGGGGAMVDGRLVYSLLGGDYGSLTTGGVAR